MHPLRRPLTAVLAAALLLAALPAHPAHAVCTADARTLCLLDSRFGVQVHWKNQHGGGVEGEGTPVPLSDKTGAFWFFDADNLELMLKILDGRPLNGRFWIFFGALSEVEYQVTVTDTTTGAQQVYLNAPGHTYGLVDTGAFSPAAQGAFCGGIAGIQCPAGQSCDQDPGTCHFADAGGRCAQDVTTCPPIALLVCGCDGKTYTNDCRRRQAHVAKAHDGACGG